MKTDVADLPLFARYPEGPGYAKGSVSSYSAAEAIAPKLRELHRAILECLLAQPLVIDEISTQVGKHLLVTRPRLTELRLLGYVEPTGSYGLSALGNKQAELRITDAGREALGHE